MLAVLALGCLVTIALTLALAWYVQHVMCPRLERALVRRYGTFFAEGRAGDDESPVSEAAETRARALLLSKLDRQQRRAWLVRRRFSVRTASGRKYTISAYRPFNIRAHDAVFCLQVTGPAPPSDKLLAQKLLLEANETLFLATANARTFSRRWERAIEAAREACAQQAGAF